jgi:hypothetical protein
VYSSKKSFDFWNFPSLGDFPSQTMENQMKTISTIAAVSAVVLSFTIASSPAFARDDGAVAAGVIGGLAAGAIIGSQVQRNYEPEYGYEPRYRARYRDCHVERQEVIDSNGYARIRRVRVCD